MRKLTQSLVMRYHTVSELEDPNFHYDTSAIVHPMEKLKGFKKRLFYICREIQIRKR